jgi:hypothetical protein
MEQQRSLIRIAVALTASLSLLAGCSSSDSTAPLAAATISTVQASDAQTGTVGEALPSPVEVKILAADGSPVVGALVSWAIESGGGTISITSSPTDSLGIATVSWTLGTVAGANTLSASTSGLAPVMLSATANAGAVAKLVKVSGDAQTVDVGAPAQPFVVKAVDVYGNAVAGATVTWVPDNGAELSVSTTVTGSDGLAQTVLTAADPTTYQVLAELQSDATIEAMFTATGN